MNKSKIKKLLWIIGGGVAVYFLLLFPPIGRTAAAISDTVFSPPVRFFSSIAGGVNDFFKSTFSISDLVKENKELKLKNAELEKNLSQISELKKENDDLRAQLGFHQNNSEFTLVEANVISRDPSGFSQNVMIDKGLSDGLSKDKSVTFGGYLVGRIKESFNSHSIVELIISPNISIPAISSDSRSQGLVKGSFGYGVSMEEIDQNEEIKIGESVITSGIGGLYPKGLLLGTIERIESAKNKIFKSASLKTLDIMSLEKVFIIK